MIKNDLYLRALKGETVERPPVWMMRQAGGSNTVCISSLNSNPASRP